MVVITGVCLVCAKQHPVDKALGRITMTRKSLAPRVSEIIMDELAGEQTPFDLEKHLSGCLAGYQTDPSE
jgi:hypothetical protein